MASNVTVETNHAAIRDLERSQAVQNLLLRKAKLIATDANRIAPDADDGFVAVLDVGPNRARAAVYTRTAKAMLAEAEDHVLLRALDAGRG
jgi:hypothetical protein